MKYRLIFFIVVACSVFGSCKEEYEPPMIAGDPSFLVVEGFLNSGSGPTVIKLSQTTRLSDTIRLKPVERAQLTVEGKDNRRYPLTYQSRGDYVSSQLGITSGSEYRLLITLPDGRNYRSDFVVAKQTPPIDSISWHRDEDGVEVSVNTHDPDNKTRYYRWDYEETWEIRSAYFSRYKYVNGNVVKRDEVNDNVYYCWRQQPSTSILLGSSTRLEEDVIHRKPLVQIPEGAEKLAVRYSILVRQYAMDQKGYEFLQAMKKNTETLGSIFDAQPSEVRGNIHSLSNPGEVVIGYITAGSVTEKRIFISVAELPEWGYSAGCIYVMVPNHPDSIKKSFPFLEPFDAYIEGISIISYYASVPPCVDCTLRGTKIKPSFW